MVLSVRPKTQLSVLDEYLRREVLPSQAFKLFRAKWEPLLSKHFDEFVGEGILSPVAKQDFLLAVLVGSFVSGVDPRFLMAIFTRETHGRPKDMWGQGYSGAGLGQLTTIGLTEVERVFKLGLTPRRARWDPTLWNSLLVNAVLAGLLVAIKAKRTRGNLWRTAFRYNGNPKEQVAYANFVGKLCRRMGCATPLLSDPQKDEGKKYLLTQIRERFKDLPPGPERPGKRRKSRGRTCRSFAKKA